MLIKSVILLYLFNSFYLVECAEKKHIGSACVGQDNIPGTCLELYKCPSAVITYLYFNNGYNDVPIFPEVCSSDDLEPVVCCTDCFIDEKSRSMSYQLDRFGKLVNPQFGSQAEQTCHRYIIYQDYPCLSMDSVEIRKYLASNKSCHLWRVESLTNVSTVGDGTTEKTELRHLALIGYGKDKDNVQWLCAGTVVDWYYILISAHCASHPTLGPATYVASALHNPKQKWRVREVELTHIHPDYKPSSRYHDIALLYLVDRYDFDKDLLPACMDFANYIPQAVQGVDWSSFDQSDELAQNLNLVNQYKLDDAKCRELFPPDDTLEHGYDHLSQTCYGNPDQINVTCEDNNAGLIQTSYHDCQYTVTGLKVYSKGCGTAGGASLYTRVRYYRPWIKSIMWKYY